MAARRRTAARPLDRRSPLPLWSQLSEDLLRRLEAGAFAERFPSEHELMADYDVSRYTVRDALRRLREQGVVDSARGRGTFVRSPRIEQPLGAMYSLFREVEARGMEQRSTVQAQEARTDARVAERLGLAPDEPLFYLERLRLADAEPLALDHAWLPLVVAEPLLRADFTRTGLYDQLAELTGVRLTGGQESIRAVVPDAAQRRALGIGTRVAGLFIERTGCLRGTPTEWRETLVRGDRFSVVAQWSPRSGYRMDVSGANTVGPGGLGVVHGRGVRHDRPVSG